jgi:hypothetical protein
LRLRAKVSGSNSKAGKKNQPNKQKQQQKLMPQLGGSKGERILFFRIQERSALLFYSHPQLIR